MGSCENEATNEPALLISNLMSSLLSEGRASIRILQQYTFRLSTYFYANTRVSRIDFTMIDINFTSVKISTEGPDHLMTSTEPKRSLVQLSLSGPANEHNKHSKTLIIRNEAQVAGNTNRLLVLFNLVGEMMGKSVPE